MSLTNMYFAPNDYVGAIYKRYLFVTFGQDFVFDIMVMAA